MSISLTKQILYLTQGMSIYFITKTNFVFDTGNVHSYAICNSDRTGEHVAGRSKLVGCIGV